MTDETVRTKALNFGRSHWKMVAAWVIAAASTLVNISMTLGHKEEHRENMEANYAHDKQDFTDRLGRIESKVDALGSIPAQVGDLGNRMSRMEDNWDNAFQHAGDNPKGHRTRK